MTTTAAPAPAAPLLPARRLQPSVRAGVTMPMRAAAFAEAAAITMAQSAADTAVQYQLGFGLSSAIESGRLAHARVRHAAAPPSAPSDAPPPPQTGLRPQLGRCVGLSALDTEIDRPRPRRLEPACLDTRLGAAVSGDI